MSKLLLFDFKCMHCGHQCEELVESSVHALYCDMCSESMDRVISPVRLNWREMGLDPGFPSCQDKWAKMQEQKARKEDSSNLVHY